MGDPSHRPSSTYGYRFTASKAHEDAVIARLRENGWQAVPMGLILTTEMRSAMQAHRSADGKPVLLRWMPDVFTWFTRRDGSTACRGVDAKSELKPSHNNAIETDAINAALAFTEALGLPTFFVFEDFGAMTAREFMDCSWAGPQSYGHGSGTPFRLAPKGNARPFNEVFQPAKKLNP